MDTYVVTDILGNKYYINANSVYEYDDSIEFIASNNETVAIFTKRNIIGYVKRGFGEEESKNEN